MLGSAVAAAVLPSCSSGSAPAEADGETRQLREKLVELRRQELALTAELAVARGAAPYLVVDIPGRTVELKARGRSLRRFSVLDGRTPGCGEDPSAVWTMTDRRPLQEVERPRIAPGAGESAVAEAAKNSLWGPARMPSDFDLVCERGNVLQVRALPAQGSRSGSLNWIRSAYRRSVDSLRQWRTPETQRPRCFMQLWLAEDNSRLLFWSLPKQIDILILRGPASR